MWDDRFFLIPDNYIKFLNKKKIGCNMIEPIQTVGGYWVLPYCVTDLEDFTTFLANYNISKQATIYHLQPENFPTDNNTNPITPTF